MGEGRGGWRLVGQNRKLSFGACALSHLSCPTLGDPRDCSPPDSPLHGILQAGILEWLLCPPPGDLPDPRIETTSLSSPALAGGFLTASATWEARASVQP